MNSYEVVKSYYSEKRDFELLRINIRGTNSYFKPILKQKKNYKSKKWLGFRVCQNFDSKPVYSAYTRPRYKCLNAFMH